MFNFLSLYFAPMLSNSKYGFGEVLNPARREVAPLSIQRIGGEDEEVDSRRVE